MWIKRTWWLLVCGAAVVATGCGLAVWAAWLDPLVPDPGQARAMMPAIVAYLNSPAYGLEDFSNYSAADHQSGRVRWLCDAAVEEVRPDGGRWKVGVDVSCGDYDRRGGLVYQEDGGDMGHAVMVLSGGDRFQVVSVAREPDANVPNPAWVSRNFSARAAAEINGGQMPMAPMPDNLALQAFGCAPGAKGSGITVGQNYSWAMPCRPA